MAVKVFLKPVYQLKSIALDRKPNLSLKFYAIIIFFNQQIFKFNNGFAVVCCVFPSIQIIEFSIKLLTYDTACGYLWYSTAALRRTAAGVLLYLSELVDHQHSLPHVLDYC